MDLQLQPSLPAALMLVALIFLRLCTLWILQLQLSNAPISSPRSLYSLTKVVMTCYHRQQVSPELLWTFLQTSACHSSSTVNLSQTLAPVLVDAHASAIAAVVPFAMPARKHYSSWVDPGQGSCQSCAQVWHTIDRVATAITISRSLVAWTVGPRSRVWAHHAPGTSVSLSTTRPFSSSFFTSRKPSLDDEQLSSRGGMNTD